MVFILLFATAFFYYRQHLKKAYFRPVYVFFAACVLLVLPTFFDIDSASWGVNSAPMKEMTDKIVVGETPRAIKQLPVIQEISCIRIYHNGLFRVPHVAAYFFGFLGLFFLYRFGKIKNYFWLIPAFLAFALNVSYRLPDFFSRQ